MGESKRKRKVRYAVVGLGHIAQVAVLTGFKHAPNSELKALVSGDVVKLRKLGRRYQVRDLFYYEQYDHLLRSGLIDAVYIALPNDMHADFAIRAARAGVHVLCEKPMALDGEQCLSIIDAADEARIKLMIAYRLHFEKANLEAIRIAKSGKLGELRYFNSLFSYPAKSGNIRTQNARGGGPLYDIGIYCINAARYLFRDEPTEVFAFTACTGDKRFKGVEESITATLKFPGARMASFTASLNAAAMDTYQLVGTKGDLLVKDGYEYAVGAEHHLTIREKTKTRHFKAHDQFGPEICYFSECILKNRQPEPSGWEGYADVRIIDALFQSALEDTPVALARFRKTSRPDRGLAIERPKVREPELVRAEGAQKKEAA